MDIGGKIKKLRTAKLMTQSELAGTEITRNMLSRIENGSANPSLETICYLAERLHVSPGFLLAEEQDDRMYRKQNEIDAVKKAMVAEDYEIVRDICEHSENASDDEMRLILAECNLALAKEAFFRGSLRHCAELLDEAVEAGEDTLYRTEYINAVAGVYFRYMQRISATLGSNVIDEETVNVFPALTDDFCRYAVLLSDMESGEEKEWRGALSVLDREDAPLSLHLCAKEEMAAGNYAEAYGRLHQILTGELPVPRPVLYDVFCDLEICCRECEDFKGAYEYANHKPVLLQQLLS